MAGNPQWQILIDEFKPQNSIVVVSSETQNARSATNKLDDLPQWANFSTLS